MKIHPLVELTYCTNVHPAESFQELMHVITADMPQVKAVVHPHAAMGSGLRIGHQMLHTLQQEKYQRQLLHALDQNDIYVFTVNGFPYGDFTQKKQIKQEVYLPDWSSDERCQYTIDLAKLLTTLPGPSIRSISTVAGGFQPQPLTLEKGRAFQAQFKKLVEALIELEEKTGTRVCVALEPEPWTTLEFIQQVPPFFEQWIHPVHPLATRYLGICYDTCHQALAFEDAYANWQHLIHHEIPIYKVQVSNALQCSPPFDQNTQDHLFRFIEPRYLHQINGYHNQSQQRVSLIDLPPLQELLQNSNSQASFPATLPAFDQRSFNHYMLDQVSRDQKSKVESWMQADVWRCHFHVPIFWSGNGPLQSTQEHWKQATECVVHQIKKQQQSIPLHMEIETYSWSVIPQVYQKNWGGIHQGIIEEFQYFQNHFKQSLL